MSFLKEVAFSLVVVEATFKNGDVNEKKRCSVPRRMREIREPVFMRVLLEGQRKRPACKSAGLRLRRFESYLPHHAHFVLIGYQ